MKLKGEVKRCTVKFKWHLFGYISSRFHAALRKKAMKSNCSNGTYQTDVRAYFSYSVTNWILLSTNLSDENSGWNASVAKKTSLSFAKPLIRLEIWSRTAPQPTRLRDSKLKM